MLEDLLTCMAPNCNKLANEYYNCFEDEGGCGEWAWCSDECMFNVDSRGRHLAATIIWEHIDHDFCNGECCANRHTMLDYWTVCVKPRQLSFAERYIRSIGAAWSEIIREAHIIEGRET